MSQNVTLEEFETLSRSEQDLLINFGSTARAGQRLAVSHILLRSFAGPLTLPLTLAFILSRLVDQFSENSSTVLIALASSIVLTILIAVFVKISARQYLSLGGARKGLVLQCLDERYRIRDLDRATWSSDGKQCFMVALVNGSPRSTVYEDTGEWDNFPRLTVLGAQWPATAGMEPDLKENS